MQSNWLLHLELQTECVGWDIDIIEMIRSMITGL